MTHFECRRAVPPGLPSSSLELRHSFVTHSSRISHAVDRNSVIIFLPNVVVRTRGRIVRVDSELFVERIGGRSERVFILI